MHFVAVMWRWKCVGIWVVKEDESPQATDPMRRIAFHTELEGFWQSTERGSTQTVQPISTAAEVVPC